MARRTNTKGSRSTTNALRQPPVTILNVENEQRLARMVARFLGLLPDTFDEIAEPDAATELSQLSFGLAGWAEDALGSTAALEEARDTSMLELPEEAP